MASLWTEDPRLAELYDAECVGRRDHDAYLELAEQLGARSLVDIGCGTGVFAVDVAAAGRHVIGVDPAAEMLDIARRRPGGERVEWVHGTADDVPGGCAELVIMMGHVAQYFVEDDDWAHLLGQVRRVLVSGGHLAFETRNPAIDWTARWTPDRTRATYPHPDAGEFTSWVEVVGVSGPPDSYTSTHAGHTVLPGGQHLVTQETLRFRSADEIVASLDEAGFAIEHRWGDWDRRPATPTSDEIIVLARRR
ncbi:MAG: class I SAM-dependent methyltransferase [Acidimicrobiales bacterium]